jgi:hypothetical protein
MFDRHIGIDASIAERLAAEAARRGKRAHEFANELLDAVLQLSAAGGTPGEIVPAWKTMSLSRDIGGIPLLPRILIRNMVDRIYSTDPEWLVQEWFLAGRQLGDRLRVLYPTIEDLQAGAERLMPLVAERLIDVRRVSTEEERQSAVRVRVETDLTPATSACGEKFIAGVLSAYPFQPTESHVDDGAIEVTGVYQGRRGRTPATEPETASESTREPSEDRA